MKTVNEIIELVEHYRTSGGSAEHCARYDHMRNAIEELVSRIDKDMRDWYRLHYLMKKYGWHPGRTDDDLLEILEHKIDGLFYAKHEQDLYPDDAGKAEDS